LNRDSQERVKQAISRTLQEDFVQAEGVLRQIDLDDGTITLRVPDSTTETRCKIAHENQDLLEIAKASLDHRVVVFGTKRIDPTRRQSYPLQVREIQVLDRVGEELLPDRV
jgi:hypothetical protein